MTIVRIWFDWKCAAIFSPCSPTKLDADDYSLVSRWKELLQGYVMAHLQREFGTWTTNTPMLFHTQVHSTQLLSQHSCVFAEFFLFDCSTQYVGINMIDPCLVDMIRPPCPLRNFQVLDRTPRAPAASGGSSGAIPPAKTSSWTWGRSLGVRKVWLG